jgi:ribosomal protein S4
VYRNFFYDKKKLRCFYGKIKETTFRNFFTRYLGNVTRRNKSFFFALETRLDMFFFRMRFFPTVFTCNQFIQHHGLLVNSQFKNSANYLVRVGDVVSLPYSK